MRYAMIPLLLIGLLSAVGCERQKPEDADPKQFDPNIDAAVRVRTPAPDPTLIADQTQISRQRQRDAETPVTPAAPTGPAVDPNAPPVEQVKVVVAQMLEASQKVDVDGLAKYFVTKDAEVLVPLMQKAKKLNTQQTELTTLVKNKLGQDMPQIKAFDVSESPWGKNATLDQIKFEVEGDNVRVTGSNSRPTLFVKQDGQWRMETFSSDQQRQMAGEMLAGMMDAQAKLFDALKAGINGGSITKENFTEKYRALNQEYMTPPGGMTPPTE